MHNAQSPARLLNSPSFSGGLWVLLLLGLAWSGSEFLQERWVHAASLATAAGVAGAGLAMRARLPAFFGFLVALAALLNAGGYVLSLWHQRTSFDEALHFFTSFAGLSAIGWGLARHWASGSAMSLFLTLSACGIALGGLWEGFEWLVGVIGSVRDTLIDLLMDTGGAVAAAALSAWNLRSNPNAGRSRRGAG